MRPVAVLVCALGGEGGGVLAEWLYGAAVRAGHAAQATSIPGVAQRTGATTYYVEVWPEPAASHPGRRPAFSLSPVPGHIDLLVSSELLETVRQVGLGMVAPDRTTVISSTARALTVAEKIVPTDGRSDAEQLAATLQRHARAAELLDFSALAAEAGAIVGAVLLGAVAASGVLPFGRAVYEDTVRATGKGVAASLRGFALAFDAVSQRRAQHARIDAALAPAAPLPTAPPPDLRALGRARVASYQDEAYARLYDERLDRFGGVDADGAIRTELARWLALWMAFDDIVRVAALKLTAGRVMRVRREVGAGADDVVRLYDHFKPGVPELAALLPARWAARLDRWDRRRVAAGRDPWALPLQLGNHTVAGVVALRVAAGLKGWRRRGRRFGDEQALIERWLAAVAQGARRDPALGLELARCGRLVKGYGSTNERGKANLLHIVDHLAATDAPTVQAARDAALADDAGIALDAALVAHGAPPRPLREQVVRFHRRHPANHGASATTDPAPARQPRNRSETA
ncbi:MAG: indolepyruvate oxidoreductase subunit beta family protein [Rubrivivax sp.]